MRPLPPSSWKVFTDLGTIAGQGLPTFGQGVSPSKSGEPAEWLRERLLQSPKGTTLVGSVIPTGFAAYARALYPARMISRLGHLEPVQWKAVATWSGRIVHPQMQWENIIKPT